MTDQQQYSIGEVYRLCERIDDKLTQLNGTVIRHEKEIAVLQDRSATQSDPAARWGALGGGVGVVLLAVWQVIVGQR